MPGFGQDLSLIFGNVELLLSVNKDLLSSLNTQVVKDPSEMTFRVGDVFLSMSNQLMCYEQYCTNHKRCALPRLPLCRASSLTQTVLVSGCGLAHGMVREWS